MAAGLLLVGHSRLLVLFHSAALSLSGECTRQYCRTDKFRYEYLFDCCLVAY